MSSTAGKVLLLKGFKTRLAQWRELLTRFLRSEDDQVEPGVDVHVHVHLHVHLMCMCMWAGVYGCGC